MNQHAEYMREARRLVEAVGDNPQFDALIDVLPSYAFVYNYRFPDGTCSILVKMRRHRYFGLGPTLDSAIADLHRQVVSASPTQ